MINNLFTIIVFILFSCINKQEVDSQNKDDIQMISVKYIDFSIMTPIDVNCSKYEKSFKNQYLLVKIHEKEKIEEIIKLFDELDPVDSTYSSRVDVRAKIEIHYKKDNNKVSAVCLGNLSLLKDGTVYKNSEKIKKYVEEIMYD